MAKAAINDKLNKAIAAATSLKTAIQAKAAQKIEEAKALKAKIDA